MKVLLTSCGLETENIENTFKSMLPKAPDEIRAMFIPTAANSPDAVQVLPKCLNDLLKVGIRSENIFVYDLHDELKNDLRETCDVIYLCGGDPGYLLKRVNAGGFNSALLDFIAQNGVVVGVSAGSMIFADDMENNLGLLKCALHVHCSDDDCTASGQYSKNSRETIRLGNSQALILGDGDIKIIG